MAKADKGLCYGEVEKMGVSRTIRFRVINSNISLVHGKSDKKDQSRNFDGKVLKLIYKMVILIILV